MYISCDDQELEITQSNLIASGGVQEVEAVFAFSDHWDNCLKTMVCYQNKQDVYHQILVDDHATIPWEVLANKGTVYIGVFGMTGGVTRTSNKIKIKIVEGALTGETAVADPSPSVYEQLMKLYHIENGFWFIGSTNTGVRAEGIGIETMEVEGTCDAAPDEERPVEEENHCSQILAVAADRTLTAEDAGKFLRVDGSAAVTVPALTEGMEVEIFRNTEEVVTVAPSEGVSFAVVGQTQLQAEDKTVSQYGSVVLKQIAPTVWSVQGAME